MKMLRASPIICFAALTIAAGAAVRALETTVSPSSAAPVPWHGTDHQGKPTSADVEIVRSVELNYGLNQRDSATNHRSGNTSNSTNSSDPALKENSEIKPLFTFQFDDVLLHTDSEKENTPRKEIRARSILEEEETDNDFDFHSRLLLGKILLRRSDNGKSASVRQSRVLDFEPIHTSKNDYPTESVPKKQSPRRYSARHRAKNVTNRINGSNSRRQPTVEPSIIDLNTRSLLEENKTRQEEFSHNKETETVVAAANRLEFGAKTSNGGERGSARYKLRTHAQQTTPSPSKNQDIYLVSSTVAPLTEYRESPEELQKATHTGEEKRNEPYSSVTIQRGTIHQIPEAITKHINIEHPHVRKQPTQVIFIQPFTEYENRPSSPHLPSAPVFDNHQWIPIQAEDAYVPVLVNPPHRTHVKTASLSNLQQHDDQNVVNHVKHVHPAHYNEAVPLHIRLALQHLPSPSHVAPSTYVDAHRSLDLSTQHTVPEYLQRGWTWTFLQHPRTDSS